MRDDANVSDEGPPVNGGDSGLFRFKSPGLEVEFAGPEEFVEAQIAHLRKRMLREMGLGARATPAPETSSAKPSLEDFYRRARSREGRGALQETILIFAYFVREYRSKDEFSIENLNGCFSLVGVTPPKSLANTLGIMKRSQRFFAAGSQRGHYALTEKGVAYVRRLIGAQ